MQEHSTGWATVSFSDRTPFRDFTFICSHTKLTPWSRALLEKLVNKFLVFSRIWRFITAFTTASLLFPSSTRLIRSGPSVSTKCRYLQPAEGLLVSQKWLRSASFVASTVKVLQKTWRLVSLRSEVRPTANVDTVIRHDNCSRATEHVNRNETVQYPCPANYVIKDSSTWRPLQEAALAISCFRLGTNTALRICIVNITSPVSIAST